MLLLTMTPMKDYLIALGFTFMYYNQGMKTRNKSLNKMEQEKMLFENNMELNKGMSANI